MDTFCDDRRRRGIDPERRRDHSAVTGAGRNRGHLSGFQYICSLNSDAVRCSESYEQFDSDSFVQLRLADESDEGRLLGVRF